MFYTLNIYKNIKNNKQYFMNITFFYKCQYVNLIQYAPGVNNSE